MKKRPAFTFIELIIAVTIFGIVAVSIYSTFRAGANIWVRSNSIIEANQESRIFFDVVSLDLKNVIRYSDSGVNFEGSLNKMSFMTLINVSKPGAPLGAELVKVVYEFDSGKKVLKRKTAGKAEGFDDIHAKVVELVKMVEGEDFSIKYCYKGAAPGEAYIWKDEWDNRDKIPRAVKIKIGEFEKAVLIATGELLAET